jgi:uncharacterized protein (UPF0332 family)
LTVANRIIVIEKLQKKSATSLQEAKLLFDEGFYGTAISCAYYRKKHSGVLSAFAEQFIKAGIISKGLFDKMRKAFEERQIADYDFEITKNEEEAKEILKDAEDFATEVLLYLNNWINENKFDS